MDFLISCIVAVAVIAVIVLAGYVILAVAARFQDPELCLWPSITRCRLCEKLVYVWQKNEFRDYEIEIRNPGGLPEELLAGVSARGIVHCRCQGTPKATFTAYAAPGRERPPARQTVRRLRSNRCDN
ncbi:MAG: hypothetical protein WCT10_05230 [Patescibacteria group bacterium]